jgi:hypothetical protein
MAVSGYSGRPIGRVIDKISEAEATKIDVTVNSGGSVALILISNGPTIWKMSWTPGTRISAVLALGYHRNVIAGLAPETPYLVSSSDDGGPCEYFSVDKNDLSKLNTLSHRVFGNAVNGVSTVSNGAAIVGNPVNASDRVITSDFKTVESFFDPDALPAGQAGVDLALAKGFIRKPTVNELASYGAVLKPLITVWNPKNPYIYIVEKKFRLPVGQSLRMHTFIVPKGNRPPDRMRLGHGNCQVYDFNRIVQ